MSLLFGMFSGWTSTRKVQYYALRSWVGGLGVVGLWGAPAAGGRVFGYLFGVGVGTGMG